MPRILCGSAALVLALSAPALAQQIINPVTPLVGGAPASGSNPMPTSGTPAQSSPTGSNVTVGTNTQVIPAATRRGWAWQAMGSGYGCVSWTNTSPAAPTSNAATATCSNGFLFTSGSTDNSERRGPSVASSALYATGASGSALVIQTELLP